LQICLVISRLELFFLRLSGTEELLFPLGLWGLAILAPRQSVPEESPYNQDMMLQKDHGPVPIATIFAVTFAATFAVTFPEDPKKEIDDPLALY
jgi:hypothetical protein